MRIHRILGGPLSLHSDVSRPSENFTSSDAPVIFGGMKSNTDTNPSESITVKCPECGHQFPLSEGVLSSVRDTLSQELQGDITNREEKLAETKKILVEEQSKLKQQQDELNDKVQDLVDQQVSKKEAEIREKAEERAKKRIQEANAVEMKALKDDLEAKDVALKKAGEAEEAARKKQRELQNDLENREKTLAESKNQLQEQLQGLKRKEEEIQSRVQSLVDEGVQKKEAAIREDAEARAAKRAEEAVAVQQKALQEDLAAKAEALKKAQESELQLQREKRQLAEEKEAMSLEVERKLNAERDKIRESVIKQADEENRLKFAEKDKQMADLQAQLKEAQRKAEQGSMQTQGDVLEVDFEAQLKQTFPIDNIAPVSTGVRGADVTQEVVSNTGRPCGKIIYETKRTKNWSNDWPSKLKGDLREARADIAMIVTQALPAEIERFGQKDGVWVADYASAIPLAHALRSTLHEVMLVKGHQQGAKEKQALLYDYLTGNDFRQRVQAVIEAFTSMREDLEKEKRALTKYWSKRDKQLGLVMDNMSGMFGDVQALSGGAIEGIESLELEEVTED